MTHLVVNIYLVLIYPTTSSVNHYLSSYDIFSMICLVKIYLDTIYPITIYLTTICRIVIYLISVHLIIIYLITRYLSNLSRHSLTIYIYIISIYQIFIYLEFSIYQWIYLSIYPPLFINLPKAICLSIRLHYMK